MVHYTFLWFKMQCNVVAMFVVQFILSAKTINHIFENISIRSMLKCCTYGQLTQYHAVVSAIKDPQSRNPINTFV